MFKWIQGGISAVTGIAEPEYGKNYIHTCTDRVTESGIQACRELERSELDWLVPDHTNVETAIFYFSDLKSGLIGFAQIIHSNIVGLHTQAQFTFRIYDSHNPDELNLWTSTKLENFRVNGTDFFADNLSIVLNEAGDEYHLKSSVNELSVVDLTFKRLVNGVKVGDDPITYFGDNVQEPWGMMRHVFWPRNKVEGTIDLKFHKKEKSSESASGKKESEAPEESETTEAEVDEEKSLSEKHVVFTKEDPVYSLYIMAIQGMKPHHAAKSWNFLNFHSKTHSVVMIEFTTPKSYANTKVSVAIVTSNDKVLSVCVDNNYKHLNAEVDSIGWNVPKQIWVSLQGYKSDVTDAKISNQETTDDDRFTAKMEATLDQMVERVDVMNEIPQFVKNIVSGIAGTKPFIYQYANHKDCTLQIEGEEKVNGLGWIEVTFISESDVVTTESYDEQ